MIYNLTREVGGALAQRVNNDRENTCRVKEKREDWGGVGEREREIHNMQLEIPQPPSAFHFAVYGRFKSKAGVFSFSPSIHPSISLLSIPSSPFSSLATSNFNGGATEEKYILMCCLENEKNELINGARTIFFPVLKRRDIHVRFI